MGGPPDVWGIELHDHSVILGKSTGKVMIQHPVSLAQKATVSLPKPIAEEFQERVENCKTRCFDSKKRGGSECPPSSYGRNDQHTRTKLLELKSRNIPHPAHPTQGQAVETLPRIGICYSAQRRQCEQWSDFRFCGPLKINLDFPGGSMVKKKIHLRCRKPRRHGFDPCVAKIPWRRTW